MNDWIVIGGRPNEVAWCQRCGEGLVLAMPVRVELFLAVSEAFTELHSTCEPGQHFERSANTLDEWITGRDTGISSATIWSVMTGRPSPYNRSDPPRDPDDFGRCYRLLKLFPAWREGLSAVAGAHPAWTPYVFRWGEMTCLYEAESPSGRCSQLYKLMKELEQ